MDQSLNIRLEVLKLLEGKASGGRFTIGTSKDFLNGAPATWEIKPTMEIKKRPPNKNS